jgi:hypothetical protein
MSCLVVHERRVEVLDGAFRSENGKCVLSDTVVNVSEIGRL